MGMAFLCLAVWAATQGALTWMGAPDWLACACGMAAEFLAYGKLLKPVLDAWIESE